MKKIYFVLVHMGDTAIDARAPMVLPREPFVTNRPRKDDEEKTKKNNVENNKQQLSLS